MIIIKEIIVFNIFFLSGSRWINTLIFMPNWQIVISTYRRTCANLYVFGSYYIHISRGLTVFRFPNWNLHSKTSNPSHNSYNIILGWICDAGFRNCLLCVPKFILLYSIMHTHFSDIYVSGKAEK